MSVNIKHLGAAITSLSFAAIFLFFGAGYGSHMCYQEQYQLFEWTGRYFADTVMVPGGLSDWTGRFLTQFFFNGWVGAAIIALLLMAVQALCFSMARKKTAVTYVCSYVPALFLLLYFLDSSALAGAVVSVILSLSCSLALRRSGASRSRTVVSLLAVPVLYFLAGPAALLFAVTIPRDESAAVRSAAVILLLAMPFAMVPFFHYPLRRLLTGIHYCRIPQNIPVFLWCSIASAILFVFLSSYGSKVAVRKNPLPVALVLGAVLAVVAILMVRKNADTVGEELMGYDRLVYLQDWDGVISKASGRMPDKPLSVSSLNLALARKGVLGESQFNYLQSGEAGLFPTYSISYFSLLPTSEIYWHLGMVGACQQYTFESQEAIPDFQKSARCYKRLAETYIVNHDYDVARKYLRTLCNTLHYRSWAYGMLEMLDNEEAVEKAYGSFRANRAVDPDVLFNESNKAAMLKMLLDRNPENTMARDYLISLMLLAKDLDGAGTQIMEAGIGTLPKCWQEALIMQCASHGLGFDTLPDAVREENVSRMKDFIGAMQSKRNATYMKNHFGSTYWYYCIYE